MDIFSQPKPADQVSHEIDGLQKYVALLLVEKEVLTLDLEGYNNPGYEHLKNKVLPKEKVRIALVRMTIAADDQVAHERLQGQGNEVDLLARRKDDIERDLAVIERKISESQVKIDILKKRLEAQLKKK